MTSSLTIADTAYGRQYLIDCDHARTESTVINDQAAGVSDSYAVRLLLLKRASDRAKGTGAIESCGAGTDDET